MSSNKKTLFKITGVILFVILLVFIGIKLSFPNNSKQDDGYKYVIGISYSESYSVMGRAFQNEVNKYAAKYKDVNVLLLDCGNNSQRRKEDITSFVKEKVDLIIFSTTDTTGETENFKQIHDAKIPLIVLTDSMTDVDCELTIKTNYKEMGRLAGEYVSNYVDEKKLGDILEIQATPLSRRDIQIKAGFREALEDSKYASIKHILAGYDSYDITLDRLSESQLIKPNLNIDATFAHSDSMAMAVAYLFKIYKTNKSIIVGVGGRSGAGGGLEAVRRGKISSTVVSSLGVKEALDFALCIINGEVVPSSYTLPVSLVTLDNVKSFEEGEV